MQIKGKYIRANWRNIQLLDRDLEYLTKQQFKQLY